MNASPIRCRCPRPLAEGRLICFPHAGGAASFYLPWTRLVPAAVELVAIQYAGREDRIAEPTHEDMDGLVDDLATAVEPLLDRPAVLFGHSLGASVAYEVAARLRYRSSVPILLAASARSAPGSEPLPRQLSDDDLWADLRRLGGTCEGVLENDDVRDVAMPSLRADHNLNERYVHAGRARVAPTQLDCRVVACVGAEDPDVSAADAAMWASITNGPTDVWQFAGGHFYLRPDPSPLLARISHALQYELVGCDSTP